MRTGCTILKALASPAPITQHHSPMKTPIISSLLLSLIVAGADATTWTNREGQTMEAELVSVEGESVVFSRNGRTYNYAVANLSDADQKRVREQGERIREQAERERRSGAVARDLSGQLVQLKGSSMRNVSEADVANKKLFAFYYSASWCGPCRQFTPDLVNFYNKVKSRHPEFELVFVSSDRNGQAMEAYMKEYKMEFPAVRFDRKDSLAIATRHKQRGIPNLVFIDGSGEVLSQSYVNGSYVGPRKVLADIEKHLAAKK
jgi:nucleoredoxin